MSAAKKPFKQIKAQGLSSEAYGIEVILLRRGAFSNLRNSLIREKWKYINTPTN